MKLSIIFPAHNEEKRIVVPLKNYARFFQREYKNNFEILVIINACRDNTLGVVKELKKKYPQIRYLNYKPGGKGFAITKGFKHVKGDLVGFVDADESTSPDQFNKLINNINGFGGVVASRWMRESIVEPKQGMIRRIASRTFNFLSRVLFNLTLRDTQCGAKLFKKKVISKILPGLGVTDWAFDIDLLYNIKKEGFKIREIPIIWRDSDASKLRVVKTTIEMFLAILQLRIINSPLRRLLKPLKPLVRSIYKAIK